MKEPKSEQLINRGKIEGIDFNNPLDFSKDSWGKYNYKEDNWGDKSSITGNFPYVATFGQVRKWIQEKIKNLYNYISQLSDEVEQTKTEVNSSITTIENRVSNVENSTNNYSEKISENEYSITILNNSELEIYKQLYNVFRITRKNSGNFGIIFDENIGVYGKFELRLGPFNEKVTLTYDSNQELIDNDEITIHNITIDNTDYKYILLNEIVDPDEEIIIKLL